MRIINQMMYFLYNSNFKLKNLLGVKKNDNISNPVKYECYTFKNSKWNKEKKNYQKDTKL